MKGAWRIGTFWGIPLKVHWTFSLLLIYVLVIGTMEGMDAAALFWFVVLFMALFVCVILHEYGHALTAATYGVKTSDILILPVGGLARLERLPEKPLHELVVAIAGPLVNLAIFFLGLAYLYISGEGLAPLLDLRVQPKPALDNLIPQLILINAALFAFNLIPAFPMDGGRILRSFLAFFISKRKATQWATMVGMVLSLGFIAIGIYTGNIILAFVGLVVLVLARAENKSVQLLEEAKQYTAEDLVDRRIGMANEWSTPDQLRTQMVKDTLSAVIVRDLYGEAKGYITRADLLKRDEGDDAPAHLWMNSIQDKASPSIHLKELIAFFKSHENEQLIPVVTGEEVIGVVWRAKVAPYIWVTNTPIVNQAEK
jgi:Zn-dependent protease